MKRTWTVFLLLCLLASLLSATALAADNGRSYDFDLTVNGEHEVQAKPGDVLTVTLTLRRTDDDAAAEMYAMQDEIGYDDTFFELVEGSLLLSDGIETTDIALQSGGRALYMNFLSLSGGESWNPEVLVGSFQMKVLAGSGASTLKNENCLVSVQDGADSYVTTAQDVTVVVSTDCTVQFESNGGSEVPAQTVHYGDAIQKPADPTREGYRFKGWYRDLNQTSLWNFGTDTVTGNMTLYAGWAKTVSTQPGDGSVKTGSGPAWWIPSLIFAALLALVLLLWSRQKKTVDFSTDGGTEMESVLVRKGKTMRQPRDPEKTGCTFGGWYRDAACTTPWNFKEDTVRKDMTLYAKWCR